MIGLDTNVLVRYLVRDDPAQARRAERLVESHCSRDAPGRIGLVTLCELYWVLRRGYRYGLRDTLQVMRGLLSAKDMAVENPDLAWRALRACEEGRAGFADYVIAFGNAAADAVPTYTFDAVAARESPFAPVPQEGCAR